MIRFTARQFHNQPQRSHQHGYLVDLWNEVRERSGGALDVTVHPQNGGVQGSDPQALRMLVAGEVEFATFMGPLLGNVHPAAGIQGVPFAFGSPADAHRAVDGPLGDYLRAELATRGLHLFPFGALENGMRQICSVARRVTRLADLEGYRMRVPATAVIRELFVELGCEPVTINVDQLGEALAGGRVDGHENPLAIVDANGLAPLTRHVALSNHIWSAFNLVANLAFWNRLPESVRDIVQVAVRRHVARQREETVALNARLATSLARQGIEFSPLDRAAFQARLGSAFHKRLRDLCGSRAWALLEESTGRLGA